MNRLIKYNLEIMSSIFVIIAAISFFNWSELSLPRQMTVIFMILYTLHEWEESKFPGGFYRIFFSKCTIDPNISEEKMHLPVAIYLSFCRYHSFLTASLYSHWYLYSWHCLKDSYILPES